MMNDLNLSVFIGVFGSVLECDDAGTVFVNVDTPWYVVAHCDGMV